MAEEKLSFSLSLSPAFSNRSFGWLFFKDIDSYFFFFFDDRRQITSMKKEKKRKKARRELIDKHHVRIVRYTSHCVISVERRAGPTPRPSAFVYLYLSPSISTDSFVRFVFEHQRYVNRLRHETMPVSENIKATTVQAKERKCFSSSLSSSFFRTNRNQKKASVGCFFSLDFYLRIGVQSLTCSTQQILVEIHRE